MRRRISVPAGRSRPAWAIAGIPPASAPPSTKRSCTASPAPRVLREGDIVSIDLCAYKNGFHGDGARTFAVGQVDEEKSKLIRVTEECFWKAVENLRAGTPLYDIGAAVQKHAEENGFSVVREYVGHGIGREMHEDPFRPQLREEGYGRPPAGRAPCCASSR